MICAFACENDKFDAEVYRLLLQIELGSPVEAWKTDMVFSGWSSVRSQLPLLIKNAAECGRDARSGR